MKKYTPLLLTTLLWAPLTLANWSLVNDESSLTFVTTKAVHVSEVNSFDRLEGSISPAGKATLIIDLTSVDTAVGVRDGRVKEQLFEVSKFPTATIEIMVDNAELDSLATGTTSINDISGTLNLHGVALPISTQVTVFKEADGGIKVTNNIPLLINASSVSLAEGIEKLREIAGLPSISHSVSVNFQLSFEN